MSAKKIKIENETLRFQRQSQKRKVRIVRCSVLIVCEGAKTEPNYFKAFDKGRRGFVIYDVETNGLGKNTTNVVEEALRLKDRNSYDRVWAVFDKDDFPDQKFNEAIMRGRQNGVEVAWSNEAFELWYLYHFQNITTGISRTQYGEMISAAVNRSSQYTSAKKYRYHKNALENYEIMTTYGDEKKAIQQAERRHLEYGRNTRYATHNPCTTVYKLVRQLRGEDEDLNRELMEKLEE